MDTVQALERGLRILDLVAEADADPMRRGRGVPLQVLADELGVHKSSALRLVRTLIAAGYAAPAAGGPGYILGPALRRDAPSSIDLARLKRAARPFLEDLVDRTGECAHIAVADSGRALVLDDVETTAPLRVVPVSGRHVALHCTSAGKALLAFGLADVPATLPRRTTRTITTRPALEAHLAAVREAGFAYDDEENDTHTRCISAPVYGPGGAPIGCIGIDAPSVRLTPPRIPAAAAQVVLVARRLSEALGRAQTA
jgi:IclR family acetate operon transcriptional repressor